ncbi:CRA domain-containing protein [Pleurotus pulmonarius]
MAAHNMASTDNAGERVLSIESAPHHLHSLVLEYLSHKCYSKTAQAFAQDTAVKHIDADGDEIMHSAHTGIEADTKDVRLEQSLKSIQMREEVRNKILSGQVEDAISLIEQHFPSVLDTSHSTDTSLYQAKTVSGKVEYVATTSVNPAHITLNLRILAFIEACRTVPLTYPPSPTSTPDAALPPLSSNPQDYLFSPSDDVDSPHQEALLKRGQKLYAYAHMLPNPDDRAEYMEELKHVGSLLIYKVPERSPEARYLSQERREATADQVNAAILHSCGSPPVSRLELYTRYTMALTDKLHEHRVKVPPASSRPPWLRLILPDVEESRTKQETTVIPSLDLKTFLDVKT